MADASGDVEELRIADSVATLLEAGGMGYVVHSVSHSPLEHSEVAGTYVWHLVQMLRRDLKMQSEIASACASVRDALQERGVWVRNCPPATSWSGSESAMDLDAGAVADAIISVRDGESVDWVLGWLRGQLAG